MGFWLQSRHTSNCSRQRKVESNSLSHLDRVSGLALLAWLVVGCATGGEVREQYVACPYDTVWQSALDAMSTYPLDVKNKEKGLIETAWVEIPVIGRPYGVFQREGLPEKERFRTTLTLSRRHDVSVARVSERREHFGFRGGARIYQWYPIEPLPESLDRTMTELTSRLEKQGCFIGT